MSRGVLERMLGRMSRSGRTRHIPVLVTGAGVTGRSILTALRPLGVAATLCDNDQASLRDHADTATATPAAAAADITRYAVVVTSPGFAPDNPVLMAAAAAGVPIWGDVELAWRLDSSGVYGPPRRWLVVTGTNGKTTTVSMLQTMLEAAGRHSSLCGNIGDPVLDVLSGPGEFLAVELSSFQLHWAPSLRPDAGAVLNVAEDHLDWHGDMVAYSAAKAQALTGQVAIAGVDDPTAADLLRTAPARTKVGFRLGAPAIGELGVVGETLVDRAFGDPGGVELIAVADIAVPGPVGVLDALGAAALARSVGVPAEAVAVALASFAAGRHRGEPVGEIDGVRYIDDSKATNTHAAEASVLAYPRVIWVAGGLLKGATAAAVNRMVSRVAARLVGAILIGRDRGVVAEALSRHAPNIPVIQIVTDEDDDVHVATSAGDLPVIVVGSTGASTEPIGPQVMRAVVTAAREMARPGDTVLLAPAGASFDQFCGYGARGDAFAAAVRPGDSRDR